jgi:uncharacterized protein YlbG (UPF0298 family)
MSLYKYTHTTPLNKTIQYIYIYVNKQQVRGTYIDIYNRLSIYRHFFFI